MIGYVIELVLCLVIGGIAASGLKRDHLRELDWGRYSPAQRAMHVLALAIVCYLLGSGMSSPSWGNTVAGNSGYLGCVVLGFYFGWILVGAGEGRGEGASS